MPRHDPSYTYLGMKVWDKPVKELVVGDVLVSCFGQKPVFKTLEKIKDWVVAGNRQFSLTLRNNETGHVWDYGAHPSDKVTVKLS